MTEVRFGIQNNVLRKEQHGLTFEVKGNDGKSGELVVSRGGLRWFPKWKSKTNYKVSWAKLERLLIENGRKEK